MIVLDQDHIIEAETVIGAAAAGDGIFFEAPPTGRCLAGIEDFGWGAF